MNTERLAEQLGFFTRATSRLADALAQPEDEFLRDSAIQRFEFSFELAWKTLKVCLELEGLEARSPRASIREAFAIGLLEDTQWLTMLELRNLSSHTYDEALAEEVYAQLPAMLELFRALIRAIKARYKSEV